MPLNVSIERTCTGQATRGFHFIPGHVRPAGSRLSWQTFDQKHKIGHGHLISNTFACGKSDGLLNKSGERHID